MRAGWVLYCKECGLASGHHDWCVSRPQSSEDERRGPVRAAMNWLRRALSDVADGFWAAVDRW